MDRLTRRRLRLSRVRRRRRQALQRAVGKQQTLLKQAQQAWIALRDADCAFLA
ncbi:hypothetical protein CKQ90_35925, partial [Klebsiella pneumoniae]